MLRARRAADAGRRTEGSIPRSPPRTEQLLALQRTAGNRAVQRLLQRDAVRDLTPLGPAADWKAGVSAPPLFAKLAALAGATKLRDVKGTAESDINKALSVKAGVKDIKPGLNFVNKIPGAHPSGETGFVDAEGIYRGAILPVTLEGALPKVAVMLSGEAFGHGREWALATMQHEIEHAKHMEMLIDKLAAWRAEVQQGTAPKPASADRARQRFDRWVNERKDKTDKVDYALLVGEQDNKTYSTEMLAYAEGFIATFHLGPQAPDVALLRADPYPAPIVQLWHAAEKSKGAADAVKKAVHSRIHDYYEKVLSEAERTAFRDWVRLMIDLATQKPPSGDSDDVRARKLAHSRFSEAHVLDFLKELARFSRASEFARNKPGTVKAMQVEVKSDGKSERKTKVGGGEVEIRSGAEYKLPDIGDHKKAGVSLTYTARDAGETRWLQFISREIVAEFPANSGKPPEVWLDGEIRRGKRTYKLTTSAGKREWSTDTATDASAFYEEDSSVVRSGRKVALYDQPDSRSDLAKSAFDGQPKPTRVTSRAHLVMYLVREMDIVYRAEIELEWEIASTNDKPKPKPRVVSAGAASSLDDAHRAKLRQQFPKVNYLP